MSNGSIKEKIDIYSTILATHSNKFHLNKRSLVASCANILTFGRTYKTST